MANADPEAENALERARVLLDLERYRDALPLLHQALSLNAGDSRLLCYLSWAYWNAGEMTQALRFAEAAIQADPELEWGHRLRAIYLIQQGRNPSALASAREAMRLASDEPLVLHTLTRALLRNNRRMEALQVAKRLREIAPETVWAHEALALVAIRQQHWYVAEQHCRRALAIQPHSYSCLCNLGLALLNTNRLLESMDCFYEAAKSKPMQPIAQANLKVAVENFLGLRILRALWIAMGIILLEWAADAPAHGTRHDPQIWLPLLGIQLVAYGIAWVSTRRRLSRLPPRIREWYLLQKKRRRVGLRLKK